MGDPILCRLGFHKWQDYGSQFQISWKERNFVPYINVVPKSAVGQPFPNEETLSIQSNETLVTHSTVVYEGSKCQRCGIKLRRKFEKNSDGTLSCVGWEPDY
ncbi:MAG TPA: hypothetical protein VK487_10725 [Candidatus Bathyarchaeia archaeon]|nr:hypothetical protein [Candidatus Bathyarchaeia archaeon]